MALNKARLDKFLAQHCQISRKNVRLMLAQNRVLINGAVAHDIDEIIDFQLCSTDRHLDLDHARAEWVSQRWHREGGWRVKVNMGGGLLTVG